MKPISLARGVPPPDVLPAEELADCARSALLRDGRTILSYGSSGGYGPLRAWVAERHGVPPDRVVVTNGSLEGFLFLATALLDDRPGRVLVEGPTYDRPLKLLARLGAEAVPVPLDEHGLDLDALERTLDEGPAPSFLYTIPTFQNPSGRTLPLERRRRLVELAAERSLLLVEDDPYRLVSFDMEPPPTLLELGDSDRVAYMSSFSKTIAPGLRVGYLVLPAGLAAAVESVAVSTTITPSLLGQATVAEFLARGRLDSALDRMRRELGARRDAMLAALERELGPAGRWSRPTGGYFVWLDLPAGVSAAELLERAPGAGVTFVPGRDFFPGGAGGDGSIRLAYSFVGPSEIDEGVIRLARSIAASGGDTPGRAGGRPAALSRG
jgi:DNA-binding transcriptional MocR family regulator